MKCGVLLLLLFCGLMPACALAQQPVPKWDPLTPQYYPWVPSLDTIRYGVHNVAFGTAPGGDVVLVEFELPVSQAVHIYLFSVTGRTVFANCINVVSRQLYRERILTGHLATGYYLLIIETDREHIVRKIFRP